MTDKDKYIKEIENVIRQMLKPIKNIPFKLVIKSMTGFDVIAFDKNDTKDKTLLMNLNKAATIASGAVAKSGGIDRARPNEVGNDLEPFIEDALKEVGYKDAGKPKGKSGKRKSAGYPDREFTDNGRTVYLEVKSFAKTTKPKTTLRSFYFSPSDDFKVNKDGLHLLVAFEVIKDKNSYFVTGWKIVTIDKLSVDVKYEFNSDNKRLYEENAILIENAFDYKKYVE
jgi:hypothetical protein